ncbi:efflux RND transporter periplasmic adaptor subunit [Pseudogemmatithrix spongiicola]|uniref:Efflux RND transporter periplasmic adaptor subunit n=1 Tax=Pseudogemmatithrix spongiicola TaxID=3062599 RepID=A0AA49Q5F2_9BACT|nr:efflux RND transporter periplasmic adaptor subunit [Gemmatimonadaceae bacterium 'strain 138']WKW16014.1 efflux RND transporter periplasmic adaptor subunit [Gemmatimonadaceae bacterium 'strain 318']
MRALFALALVSLAACGTDQPEAAAEAGAVADTALIDAAALRIGGFTLAAASNEAWREAWRLPAHVSYDPNDAQPLGSLVEGRVLEVRAYPGDRVREGDVLVVVHSHEMMDARQRLVAARAASTSADSNLAVAQQAVGRGERLLAAKAIATAEVERLRAARTAAVATRDAAHAELERAEGYVKHLIGDGPTGNADEHAALVRAPFDGVVTGRAALPGQVVLVGQELITVARGAGLGVVMRLPEEAIAGVRTGEAVRFRVPAYPGRTFDARITRIAPVVDSTSRAIEVWARAAADAQSLLRAEMTADAELLGADGAPTLSVPAEAVQLFEGDTVVVRGTRLGEGMLIEAVPVRVGRRTSQRAEILAGLAVGDSVVTRGAALAKAEILKRQGAGEGGHDH